MKPDIEKLSSQSEAMPCITPECFRDSMASLAGAVNIVTTSSATGDVGFTATAVCSVSDNPATLLVCLNRSASVHSAFVDSPYLAINTLTEGHESLSNVFGGKAAMADRFAIGKWERLKTGSPVLADAAVAFDCKITHIQSVATHDVIFCEVVAVKQREQAGALVYFQRGYHHLCD
ncbi:flavin reductase [Aliiglaciecola sp. 3_MG-2023]|uniref:flavin reductase n=1 Tax=Aliiglaciecola sp. 3_MG-2023 TaxID=3062644 RepID=UPI0026E3C67D|nr:flavin reductase [Aliiglaciecola sp. 3_MG-2023]MDO6692933.1 flavin reductase [Aliiglaciecola sp. 3_MG-2023]